MGKGQVQMSKAAIEERGRMIEEMIYNGTPVDVVKRWATDPVIRSALNAMAQMIADSRQATSRPIILDRNMTRTEAEALVERIADQYLGISIVPDRQAKTVFGISGDRFLVTAVKRGES